MTETTKESKELKEVKEKIESMSVDEKTPDGIGDMINFKQIFRLKGYQKVWTPVSEVNKSGMIGFAEWLNKTNKKTVHKRDVIRLADFWFNTIKLDEEKKTVEKQIHISEVFNNLNAHFIDEDIVFNDYEMTSELMLIMCPDYDGNAFKPYHAKQVVKWYNEIKNKILTIERLEALKNQENE